MGSVHRRELKQNYYEWKLSFDAEHRSDIASFHFKYVVSIFNLLFLYKQLFLMSYIYFFFLFLQFIYRS